MNYLFSKFFRLPLAWTFKNCTITYPYCHNNLHILRRYEWDLLVFCKQTHLYLAAIGTLTHDRSYIYRDIEQSFDTQNFSF